MINFKNAEQLPIISLLNVDKNGMLKKINFNVKVNDFMVIAYEDRSEINSLINIIMGIDNSYDGHVYFLGNYLPSLTDKQRAMLRFTSQTIVCGNTGLFDDFNVFDNIYYSLLPKGGRKGKLKNKIFEALSYMGADEFIYKKPKEIPSHFLLRIAYARAIAREPKLIIVDYPITQHDKTEFYLFLEESLKIYLDLNITTILITNIQEFPDAIRNINLLKCGELTSVKDNKL